MTTRSLFRNGLLLGTGALLAVGLTACGSSSSSSTKSASAASSTKSGGSLSGTIPIYSIQDASGAAGAVGVDDENGSNLAIKDINNQHFLGGATLKISYGDSATSETQSASLANAAVAHKYPIVIGPPSSGTAVAAAPILAKANQPTVFTQAGSDGVLVGPSIFRMTTLQTGRYPLAVKWLQSKGIKTIAAIQDSDFPTEVQLTDQLKTEAAKDGMKVVGTSSAQAAQSNISAEVSKMLSYHAQALALNVVLTQNATAATLIKQSGFTGPIIAEDGAGNGSLSGAGSAGNGITWASDWTPNGSTGAMSANFVKEYEAAYHKTPSDWAAESYDAIWFAARGLKQAGSTDPTKVTAALKSVGAAGFPALVGTAKVVNGQEEAPPVLVQWLNGASQPLANQNP